MKEHKQLEGAFITETLLVSCSHMRAESAGYLADCCSTGRIDPTKQPAVYSTDYGWRVYSGHWSDVELEIPWEVRLILKLAEDHDIAWVEFDSDGPVMPNYPTWEW